MAGQMTDPMKALILFRAALGAGDITPQKVDIHNDVLVLVDQPQGTPRFTYALTENGQAVAVALFVLADPIDGAPCFNIGYSVDDRLRARGLGKLVVQKAFVELTNGFKRANVPHLYVEAIVSPDNEPSKKLAYALIAPNAKECTDGESGLPALQFVKQLF